MYVWHFRKFMVQWFRSDNMLKRKKMFNYDKLLKELNLYVPYILQCFKREYGTYLSDAKNLKLNSLIDSNEQLVVIDGEKGNDKVHINPINEMFTNKKYDYIKGYHLINIVIPTILKMFITTSISKSEFEELENPLLQQEFSNYLRNGFGSFILVDFLEKCRLDNKKIPKEINQDSLDFVYKLEEFLPEGRHFMNLIFYYNYVSCMEKVYDETGFDLLDIYEEHKQKRKDLAVNIMAMLEKTNMTKGQIDEFMSSFKNSSNREFLEKVKKQIKIIYCTDKIRQKEYLEYLKYFKEVIGEKSL